ncbi:hypothetical protein FisN_30Lh110 [Fistulifera solaris]|uniref:Uncharacterized protein n=1 Tax=Fistulifera solaris TaxID=1519565 RepID=A0A1Z5JII3_FISSO|nr:hypothetical protein FisN_30Lh110 [Fistulifera solaris]|eukprot:GAX13814.1 hypothetical protein FisN_30Lh110 [Fistulifera solaris]
MFFRSIHVYLLVCFYVAFSIVTNNITEGFSFVNTVTDWLSHQQVAYQRINESNELGLLLRNNNLPNATHLLWIHANWNNTKQLILHLIPSETSLDSTVKYEMTNQACQSPIISLIHLHQDQWERQTNLVQARLWNAIVQTSHQYCHERRIYARQCRVERISSPQAQAFLQQHHMWSSVAARYSYGLLLNETLVAVATFSSRRRIQRGLKIYRSHELLRFCTQSNVTVLGGCSKLVKAFERDVEPDDIVTVLDRDWTSTRHDNWKGFYSVHTRAPLPLAVREGQRYHLIGASYQIPTNSSKAGSQRQFVPWSVYQELNECQDAPSAQSYLESHGYHLLYDAGVERLLKIVSEDPITDIAVTELYNSSIPQYPPSYYSPNAGISALLRQAEEQCKVNNNDEKVEEAQPSG